jgi:hypothetical protein
MHSVMHCFFLLHSLQIGTAIFVTSAPENSFGKFQLAALFASRGSFVYMAYRVKWYQASGAKSPPSSLSQKYYICPCKNNDLERPKTLQKKMGIFSWAFYPFLSPFALIWDPSKHPKKGSFWRLFFSFFTNFLIPLSNLSAHFFIRFSTIFFVSFVSFFTRSYPAIVVFIQTIFLRSTDWKIVFFLGQFGWKQIQIKLLFLAIFYCCTILFLSFYCLFLSVIFSIF